MNLETCKVLQSKVNEIDTKKIKLSSELEIAEKNLKNYQAVVDGLKEEIKSLQKEKQKIKEDMDITKSEA